MKYLTIKKLLNYKKMNPGKRGQRLADYYTIATEGAGVTRVSDKQLKQARSIYSALASLRWADERCCNIDNSAALYTEERSKRADEWRNNRQAALEALIKKYKYEIIITRAGHLAELGHTDKGPILALYLNQY